MYIGTTCYRPLATLVEQFGEQLSKQLSELVVVSGLCMAGVWVYPVNLCWVQKAGNNTDHHQTDYQPQP